MVRSRSALTLFLLVAVAAAPYAPVLVAGRPGIAHDWQFHYAHALDFMKSLDEGVVYPRWAAAMNGGYGAPTFNFYPPLPYYLAAAGTGLTGDPEQGFFLVAALLSVFGAGSLYRLVRRDAGRVGALLAAAAFVWMPYTLLDIYHRFAWAEFNALMWLPFVLLALRRLMERPQPRHALALLVALVGLGASHLVTCLTVAPFLAAWMGYEAWRRRAPGPLLRPAVLAALSLLVLAAFLAPVLFERDLVHLDHLTTSRHGQYGRNFLWQDEVAAGFTHSPFKPTVALAAAAQLLLLAGSAGALLARRRLRGLAGFLFAAGLVHVFLATALSEPVWRVVPLLGTIQFPWRILGAFGLLAAWLFGLAADQVLPPRARVKPAALLVLLPAIVIVGLAGREIHTSYYPDQEWMQDQRNLPPRESVTIHEYVPREVTLGNLLGFVPYDPARRVVETRGEVTIDWHEWTPHRRRGRVKAGPDGAGIVLPVFRYPGWTVMLDGRVQALTRRNALNLIEFDVAGGEHDLAVVHRPATPRRVGTWISLAGLLLGVILCLGMRGRPAPPPRPLFTGRRRLLVFGAGILVLGLPVMFPLPHQRPHVVIITAPGLRADHAAFNGYVRPTTRNIDFLAFYEGVRFRRAYTPVPEAAAAAEEVFVKSGMLAHLRKAGYAIGARLGENLLENRPALAACFPDAARSARARVPAAEVVARASVWVRQHRDRPFFLWIHLAEPGGPYRPGPERIFRSPPGPRVAPEAIPPSMRVTDRAGRVLTDLAVYRDLYDETLVRTDQMLGRFVNDLYRLDLYDRSLIAVAGLSGMDLGDGPSPLVPGGSLHEVQTAVFLVVKFPGNRHQGHAVESPPVSVAQLAPTVEGLIYPIAIPPTSLIRVIEGEGAAPEVTVRQPDGSACERVFDIWKVRWRGEGPPEVLRWQPRPPWESAASEALPPTVRDQISRLRRPPD